MNENTIFWKSKKQSIVKISSIEAEYAALSEYMTKCLSIKQ